MKSREFRIVNLRCWLTFLVLSAFVLCPDNIKAQKQWNVELRPGIDFPTHTSHGNKNIGFGMEGKVICTLLPAVGAYVGWGWNLFPAENRSAFSYEATGFTYGVQYAHGKPESKMKYFMGLGGVYNRLSTERKDVNEKTDPGYTFGWQAESGVELKITTKLSIRPGLRFRSLSGGELQYLSFGVGFLF